MMNKCDSQTPTNTQTMDYTQQDSYIPVLKSQLSAGASGEKNETDYPTYQFTLKDIEATESIILQELKDNGFKKPSAEEFNNKIKEVFHRIIDPKSETKYLQIKFEDKCSKNFKLFKNSNSIDANPHSTYVFKNGLFISDFYSIPEILDYTKNSDLTKYESEAEATNRSTDVKIYYWKDLSDLKNIRKQNLKTIVARNMYFFNNSTSSITWLVQHDQLFIRNLIKYFGYDKEAKFNEYVINYLNSNPLDNSKDLSDYIASKNCEGKLEIRSTFINSYETLFNTSKNVKDLIILKYLSSKIINNEIQNTFNDQDKMKILAFMANTYDPLFKQYHNQNNDWGQMTILADYRDFVGDEEWIKAKNEYKSNNYYGLPNLKSMIEYADMFDRVGAPD
ncbi:hypothetical protein DRF60_18295 [Chryseobacterium elymi]|uniref:Uncharacterized protein n=2 Tax=Chryseobacterium elymi TaxID=395936 RepID=A0A3D9D7V6_9FLAO|nr:hypothetical protein DRF60_18295 [Chryseobacterium elymi]